MDAYLGRCTNDQSSDTLTRSPYWNVSLPDTVNLGWEWLPPGVASAFLWCSLAKRKTCWVLCQRQAQVLCQRQARVPRTSEAGPSATSEAGLSATSEAGSSATSEVHEPRWGRPKGSINRLVLYFYRHHYHGRQLASTYLITWNILENYPNRLRDINRARVNYPVRMYSFKHPEW